MVLQLDNVTYSYGNEEVIHGITARFVEGATVILGPNGAGKSTLLELIASVRQPRNGRISLDGIDDSSSHGSALKRYRSTVAWLPQTFSVFPGLRVREHVAYMGWLKGMPKNAAWTASTRALELVGLQERGDHNVRKLSGGQRRRVGIAGALVHDARVILLDEPTAGLDPAQRRRFRDVLESIADGRIVVVSSHDTDDAHSTFKNAAVLRDGDLTFQGTLEEFVGVTGSHADMRDRVEDAYLHWAGRED